MLTQLGTGEAIVTVMNEKGAPTPVAWTRLRAPQGSMSPSPAEQVSAAVAASVLLPKYGTPIDRESAREILARKLDAAAQAKAAETQAQTQATGAGRQAAAAKKAQADYDRMLRGARKSQPRAPAQRRAPAPRPQKNPVEEFMGSSMGKTVVREVVKGIFGTLLRR